MKNIKNIHNRHDSKNYIVSNYVVGSNAMKIVEEIHQEECDIFDINDHLLKKQSLNVQQSNSKKLSLRFKIIVSILFITLGIGFGSTVAYAMTPNNYNVAEYKVQAGDSLWSIASHNGYSSNVEDTMYEIRKINNLADENIKVGQTILVPSE